MLGRPERTALLADCDCVALVPGDTLCRVGDATTHVFFPTRGFISLIAGGEATPHVEVAMVGAEGMLGTELLLGVPVAPLHAMVQGAGSAWRLPAAAFRARLASGAALDGVLRRYLSVLVAQFAGGAPCLRFHAITPRLARWLLTIQDRAGAARFRSTHQVLASMLGVRRAGVTVAAGELQRKGLIHYERGVVTILDRPALQAVACGCYAADRARYDRVMGRHASPASPASAASA